MSLLASPVRKTSLDNVNLDGQKKEDSEEHKLLFLVVGMFQQEEDLNSVCVRNIARSFISETRTCGNYVVESFFSFVVS